MSADSYSLACVAQQQRQFLMVLGASLQQRQHLVCNPFGGTASCMDLPSNSSFADTCKEHDLKVCACLLQLDWLAALLTCTLHGLCAVFPQLRSMLQVDCAWYSEDLHEVAEDPTGTLKSAMKARCCALTHNCDCCVCLQPRADDVGRAGAWKTSRMHVQSVLTPSGMQALICMCSVWLTHKLNCPE